MTSPAPILPRYAGREPDISLSVRLSCEPGTALAPPYRESLPLTKRSLTARGTCSTLKAPSRESATPGFVGFVPKAPGQRDGGLWTMMTQGTLRQGGPKGGRHAAQHFHPGFFPVPLPRPGRAVRLKLPSIAWAVALIAVGVGPASVIAEDETPTTNITLHNASGVFGIGAGEKARSKAGQGLLALHREYQAYLSRRTPRHGGRPGSDRVILWRRPPRGT